MNDTEVFSRAHAGQGLQRPWKWSVAMDSSFGFAESPPEGQINTICANTVVVVVGWCHNVQPTALEAPL